MSYRLHGQLTIQQIEATSGSILHRQFSFKFTKLPSCPPSKAVWDTLTHIHTNKCILNGAVASGTVYPSAPKATNDQTFQQPGQGTGWGTLNKIKLRLLIYGYTCAQSQCTCGGQKTAFRSPLFPSCASGLVAS